MLIRLYTRKMFRIKILNKNKNPNLIIKFGFLIYKKKTLTNVHIFIGFFK